MLKIILGFIGIAAGFLVVWKSEWIYQNFGANAWAEKHLGTSGGTRSLIKIVGLIFIIASILYMTGLIQGVIMTIFSRLFMIR